MRISAGNLLAPVEMFTMRPKPRSHMPSTVGVAKAVAKHNVTINNLLPGMHHTATAEERFGRMADEQGKTYDEVVQDWIDEWRIPADRFGDIDDFGAVCALFCSAQANYIVGQNLVVDGGVTNSTF